MQLLFPALPKLNLNELPTASAHQLTINGVDFIPVLSSSIFNNDDEEVYVNIGATTQSFATNLVTAINASSSLTLVSASWSTTASINAPILVLSGSDTGSTCNVTVTTESITGNSQNIFVGANAAQATGSIGYSLQGGTDSNTGGWQSGTTGSIKSTIGIDVGGGTWYTGEGFNATQHFLTIKNSTASSTVLVDNVSVKENFHTKSLKYLNED